jgi:hypothetical protein
MGNVIQFWETAAGFESKNLMGDVFLPQTILNQSRSLNFNVLDDQSIHDPFIAILMPGDERQRASGFLPKLLNSWGR